MRAMICINDSVPFKQQPPRDLLQRNISRH